MTARATSAGRPGHYGTLISFRPRGLERRHRVITTNTVIAEDVSLWTRSSVAQNSSLPFTEMSVAPVIPAVAPVNSQVGARDGPRHGATDALFRG
jgi:hypothetical protein